jgi:hypothetical protein
VGLAGADALDEVIDGGGLVAGRDVVGVDLERGHQTMIRPGADGPARWRESPAVVRVSRSMASDPPDEDRRIRIGEWATMNGFELLDDLDQEAERLPLFVIQTTIDRDVHNVCVGLWEDTDVACFDLRRGSGGDRIDSTGATIAYPYGLPGLLILHRQVADDDRMLSSRPVIEDHALAPTYEVRSDNAAFAVAILEGALATWLMTGRAKFPPMSFELGSDWLLGYAPQLTVELFPELLDDVLGFRDRISPDVLAAFGR